jgi:hypothetical protein
LIVFPEPVLAPEIPPVMVPIVQLKVLGVEAASAIFGLIVLQVEAVAGDVTTGIG